MSDADVARTLANEVARHPRTWRRMTTLLDRFGETQLTPQVRTRIAKALNDADLVAHPPIERVERRQSVRLTMAGAPPGAHGIRFERRVGEVDWVDLDAVHGSGAELAEPLSALAGRDLHPDHIEDLLSPDDRLTPEHVGAVWKLTTFDVRTEEPAALRIQSLELVVGDRWLVSCWHQPLQVAHGAHYEHDPGEPPELQPPATAASPTELAAAILDQLSTGYGAAVETLGAWLDQWELATYRDVIDRELLRDLRAFAGQLRHRLAALHETLEELADWPLATTRRRVQRALHALEGVIERLHSAFDLLTAHYAAAQHEQAERMQDRIALITAILLVPTLLASIAGVNTALPGKNSWLGFAGLVLLMVVSGYAALRVLRR
jgi:Mg2+ and Co2+ transporter CorA